MANGNWYVIARDSGVGRRGARSTATAASRCFSGAQDIGTGFRTAMAMVAAEELGLDAADVTPQRRRHALARGPGLGRQQHHELASRPAVRLAAHDARKKLFDGRGAAAGREARGARRRRRQDLRGGKPAQGVAFKQAAAKMPGEVDRARSPSGRSSSRPTARTSRAPSSPRSRWTSRPATSASLKMVVGQRLRLPVNTLTTESQIIGAMIQGVSWALFENRILDRNVGTMVNPNLESYKILAPKDMFEAVPILTRGRQRAGTTPRRPASASRRSCPRWRAVANAVFNATGARVRTPAASPPTGCWPRWPKRARRA